MLLLGFLLLPMALVTDATADNYMFTYDDDHGLKNVELLAGGTGEVLHLSGLGLRNVADEALINLPHLRSLDIADNFIRGINASVLSSLIHLERLSLANNEMTDVPEGMFEPLKHLKSFDFSDNPLKYHLNRGVFHGMPKTCDIYLRGVGVGTISPDAFDANLTPVPSNQVTVPRAIADHEQEALHRKLPRRPYKLPRVQVCIKNGLLTRLDGLKSDEDPSNGCLFALHDGKELFLNHSGISRFARGWYRLGNSSFTGINLARNNISRVTEELLNDLPASIKYIDLSNNKIVWLEGGIIQNENLQKLVFNYNTIREIDAEAFAKTPNLKVLRFGHNRLQEMNFAFPSTLAWIDVRDNHIVKLDSKSFHGSSDLEVITLSRNYVRTIVPGTFQDLVSLEWLNLEENRLKELTNETFRGLSSKLMTLDLGHNEISKIAKGTFDLPGLRKLNLLHNSIERFEKGIVTNLEKVQSVNLRGNQITKLENGAFARFPKSVVVRLNSKKIQVIVQAGLFDDA